MYVRILSRSRNMNKMTVVELVYRTPEYDPVTVTLECLGPNTVIGIVKTSYMK